MTLTVTADHVVTDGAVAGRTRISVDGTSITGVDPLGATGESAGDLHGAWVFPGAVDLHCHGGGGASLMAADVEEVARAAAFHRRHGTTTALISLVSAPLDTLCAAIGRVANWLDDPGSPLAGQVAGIHLEGPFLSTVRCGAIDPATMIDATPDAVDRLVESAAGRLRIITVAPERPGVLEAIQRLCAAGVVVAVGHTDASGETVHEAVRRGATLATHVGNGMRPFHHRDPGPFGACLVDPAVTTELIADGEHVHPATVALALAAKGPDRATVCTDAVAAAGCPDGSFDLGGQRVTVTDGVVRLDRTGALAGSTLTADRAVANLLDWGHDPVTVAHLTARNPARLIGLEDRGVIGVGRRADLMVLDEQRRLVAVVAAGVVEHVRP